MHQFDEFVKMLDPEQKSVLRLSLAMFAQSQNILPQDKATAEKFYALFNQVPGNTGTNDTDEKGYEPQPLITIDEFMDEFERAGTYTFSAYASKIDPESKFNIVQGWKWACRYRTIGRLMRKVQHAVNSCISEGDKEGGTI